MTNGASYNRRPEGRRSGDVGDAGTLLTDTPTIFRSRSPETDAAMIRKIKNVGATLLVATAHGMSKHQAMTKD